MRHAGAERLGDDETLVAFTNFDGVRNLSHCCVTANVVRGTKDFGLWGVTRGYLAGDRILYRCVAVRRMIAWSTSAGEARTRPSR